MRLTRREIQCIGRRTRVYPEGLCRAPEIISCAVIDSNRRADLLLVAASRRRHAARGRDPLDVAHTRQKVAAGMRGRLEQKPRDGRRVGGGRLGPASRRPGCRPSTRSRWVHRFRVSDDLIGQPCFGACSNSTCCAAPAAAAACASPFRGKATVSRRLTPRRSLPSPDYAVRSSWSTDSLPQLPHQRSALCRNNPRL